MLLYTIFPDEFIFGTDDPTGDDMPQIEVRKGEVVLVTEPLPGGKLRIIKVISSNSQDYLNPKWQPGMIL